MNEQLANFFVEFTTKGITELKDGMSDILDKLDDVEDKFNKSGSKGEHFFGKIPGWVKTVATLTGAFKSLSEIINGIFDVNEKVFDLHTTASRLGVSPMSLESLNKGLRHFGGKEGDAESVFSHISSRIYDWSYGRYSDAEARVSSETGVGMFTPLRGGSNEQKIAHALDQIAVNLETIRNTKGVEAARQYAEQFLGDFGALGDVMSLGKYHDVVNKGLGESFYSDPEAFRQSVELREAKFRLQDSWEKALIELTPAITRLIDEVINPMIENFAEWAKNKDLGKILSDFVITMKNLVLFIAEIFRAAFGDGSWGDVRKAGRIMLGMSPEEAQRQQDIEKAKAEAMPGFWTLVGAGAATGAVAGSIIPGAGTAGGAIVGALTGAGVWLFGEPNLDELDVVNASANGLTQIPASPTNNYANTVNTEINIDGRKACLVSVDPTGNVSATGGLTGDIMTSIH